MRSITIRKTKVLFSCALLSLGIFFEIAVLRELWDPWSIERIYTQNIGDDDSSIAVHSYYHLMFGLSTIAGAIILASIKEENNSDT